MSDQQPTQTTPEQTQETAPTTTAPKSTKRFDDRVVEEFSHLNLKPELLHGIFSHGFEKPSAIQKKCILPITTSDPPADVIGQAQSGTGKTATFSIAMLQRIDIKKKAVQAIVLAPTRELANQITTVVKALGQRMDVVVHTCIGGSRVEDDRMILQNGVHVVVGTPGRITHMIEEDVLNVEDLLLVVIDEADEMLGPDFKLQLYEIFRHLPENLQICLFSATMPKEVFEITSQFMRDPIKVLVERDQLTLEGIQQYFIDVGRDEYKYEVIQDLYKSIPITKSVIFLNSRKRVEWLAQKMAQDNFAVSRTHSELPQDERTKTMKEFKTGNSRVLIATDLVARGIDAHQVSLVINFDMPNNRENYLHRIGRSGRYGRKGVSINFITQRDVAAQKELEAHYSTIINPLPSNIVDILDKANKSNEN